MGGARGASYARGGARIADSKGRVARERFLQFVANKFDAADKSRQGSLSEQELRRLLQDLAATPVRRDPE